MQGLRTYVINLDGSTDRLASIGRHLQTSGIDFERVPACDGRKIDLSTFNEYDRLRAERYMGRGLVGGEIGCYLSHLDVAARFLDTDARYALVLEDDALPLCNPVELLARAIPALEDIDPDWLLLNIGNNQLRISTTLAGFEQEARHCDLVAAHYFPMTTSAIVWSRKGARDFVKRHRRIFAPVDNYFRYWLTREGHGYSFRPALVATIGAASQIHAAGGGERKASGRKWYYGLAKKKRLVEDKLIALDHKMRFSRSWSLRSARLRKEHTAP